MLERNFSLDQVVSDYASFDKKAVYMANKIYDRLLDYTKLDINVVSDLTDADGLGSEIVLSRGVKLIADYLGNSFVKVRSKRVMTISKEGANSLSSIREDMGRGLYLFADIPAFDALESKLFDEAYVIDHHPEERTNPNYLNPHNYSIDGEKEFSASITSALVVRNLFDLVKKDSGNNKKVQELEEKINYLSIIGLAGSNADMQKDVGGNEALYKDLRRRNFLKEVNHPFYGHFTKRLDLVLAESYIPFNLKYRLASSKELRNEFGSSSSLENISKFKFAFVVDSSNDSFGLNKQYLENLSDEELNQFQDFAKELGFEFSKTEKGLYSSLSFIFERFEDDVKFHKKRQSLANIFLSRYGVKSDETISEFVKERNISSIKSFFKDNLIAFAEPELSEIYLNQLNEKQDIVMYPEYRLFNKKSLSELANHMTAVSKLEESELFKQVVDYELGLSKLNEVQAEDLYAKSDSVWLNYRQLIATLMTKVEDSISRKEYIQIFDKAYLFDMDKLDEGKNLEKITGVLGGLVLNNRLLPNHPLILTKYTTSSGLIKVSGRFNEFTDLDIHLGDIFHKMAEEGIIVSGGGHKSAASTKMTETQLIDFMQHLNLILGDYNVGE